jgi:hypothetical protein
MTVTAAPPVNFDMGRVISAGLGLLARQPVRILLLALALGFLPALLEAWVFALVAGPSPQPGAARDIGESFRRLGVTEPIAFVAAGFGWVLQGAVAVVAIADASGQDADIGAQLTKASKHAPLIFVAGVVATFAISLGTLLLIVPGVLLALAWSVGPAVGAVEGKGFLDIFRRSAELTRGSRGSLFAIAFLLGVVTIVVSLSSRVAAGGSLLAAGAAQPQLLIFMIQPAVTACLHAVSASVYAAAYLELRGVKEGLTAGGFAAVFD